MQKFSSIKKQNYPHGGFCKKSVLKNFAIFTKEPPVSELLFNKITSCRAATLLFIYLLTLFNVGKDTIVMLITNQY